MALIIILICLLVQRVLILTPTKPVLPWFIAYHAYFEKILNKMRRGQGWMGVLLLLGSVVVLYAIVIGLFASVLGIIFTFLFHACVLWYYLDATPVSAKEAEAVPVSQLLLNHYQGIFAILFWYVLVGPLGIILYVESRRLELHLQAEHETNVYSSPEFLQKLNYIRRLMDWVPVRILGLTFALVGQFRPAFYYWRDHFKGVTSESALVVDYGFLALNGDSHWVGPATAEQYKEIEGLITRALIAWLVILAIFTLGQFIAS